HTRSKRDWSSDVCSSDLRSRPNCADEASTSPLTSAQFGLDLVEHNEDDPRMWYYRFATDEIAWNPGVNVLVPEGYRDDGRTYPVLYLLHGGGPGQDFLSWDRSDIRQLAEDQQLIIVMPDGGQIGRASCRERAERAERRGSSQQQARGRDGT